MRHTLGLFILCATLASCGEAHDHEDDTSGDDVTDGIDSASGASDNGHLLISYFPITSLAAGDNTFDIEVREVLGAPLSGATVTLEFLGPEDAAVVATTGETSAGLYRSAVVPLPSAGDWRMTVHVMKEAIELHDHLTFQLVVP